jgi:hypothetical protein
MPSHTAHLHVATCERLVGVLGSPKGRIGPVLVDPTPVVLMAGAADATRPAIARPCPSALTDAGCGTAALEATVEATVRESMAATRAVAGDVESFIRRGPELGAVEPIAAYHLQGQRHCRDKQYEALSQGRAKFWGHI